MIAELLLLLAITLQCGIFQMGPSDCQSKKTKQIVVQESAVSVEAP